MFTQSSVVSIDGFTIKLNISNKLVLSKYEGNMQDKRFYVYFVVLICFTKGIN